MYSSAEPIVGRADKWYNIAKAIRTYLRHEYAETKLGIEDDPPPMRISAYTGKGVGHYPTGLDGRADWTQEFYAYIERAEARMVEHGELRFGFAEVDAAMRQLELEHPRWHDTIVDIDMQGMRAEQVAEAQNKSLSTIKYYRQRGTEALFVSLIGARPDKARKLFVKIIQVA